MASAKNKVIAGDYVGWDVIARGRKLAFMHRLQKLEVTKSAISLYEVIDSQRGNSFWGTFLKGYVSNAVLGPAGLMASTLGSSGKQIILVSVEFLNGKRSLLEVDEKTYKNIVLALY